MPVPQFITPLQPEPCPVEEQLLGQLYSSPKLDVAQALSTMPGLQRARLAMFCIRRAHLHSIGLTVAATCSEADLVHEGGAMGSMLFGQSREKIADEPSAPVRRRPTISLATNAPSLVIVDSVEDEDFDGNPNDVEYRCVFA